MSLQECYEQDFYANLRSEDRENVRTAVEALKADGFEVHVTGSAIERPNYRDVDLVVRQQTSMPGLEAESRLESTLQRLGSMPVKVSDNEVHDVFAVDARYCHSPAKDAAALDVMLTSKPFDENHTVGGIKL